MLYRPAVDASMMKCFILDPNATLYLLFLSFETKQMHRFLHVKKVTAKLVIKILCGNLILVCSSKNYCARFGLSHLISNSGK